MEENVTPEERVKQAFRRWLKRPTKANREELDAAINAFTEVYKNALTAQY